MYTAGPHFIKTLLHHKRFEKISFKTASFRNIFQKESVVKSAYTRCAVRTMQACNITKKNIFLGVFLRTFKTFAINYFS